MDLVNSVTQNSNNKNVTMENQPPIYNDNQQEESPVSPLQSSDHIEIQMLSNQVDSVHNSESIGNNNKFNGRSMAETSAEAVKSKIPDYLKAINVDPKVFWPKQYRFTREKTPGQYNPLSIAQRNFYENNGYLIVDDCNSPKLINAIRDEYSSSSSSSSSLASELMVDELVAKNGKLLQYIKCFCDERTMLMTHRLVDTFSISSKQVAAKQNSDCESDTRGQPQPQPQRQRLVRDWIYLPFRPIDKVVCTITAIESLDNVILVVPGTHRVGQYIITSSDGQYDDLSPTTINYAAADNQSAGKKPPKKELFESSADNLSTIIEKSKVGFKYVNLKPGQTLFYHSSLIHGFTDDLVNFEKRQLAVIAYYAAADCEYVEMRREDLDDNDNKSTWNARDLPVGLAHFNNQDPSDYHSWLNRPKLLQNIRASL